MPTSPWNCPRTARKCRSSLPPYLEGQTVSWNGNSIPVGNIKVNGAAPATAPVRTAEDNDTRIRIAFAEALHDGDVVEFGAPLVWTIREGEAVINGNCFIDPAMQYTVGTGCTLEETQLAVTAVGEPTEITREGAAVEITVTAGNAPVKAIRLHEDNGLVDDLVLNKGSRQRVRNHRSGREHGIFVCRNGHRLGRQRVGTLCRQGGIHHPENGVPPPSSPWANRLT